MLNEGAFLCFFQADFELAPDEKRLSKAQHIYEKYLQPDVSGLDLIPHKIYGDTTQAFFFVWEFCQHLALSLENYSEVLFSDLLQWVSTIA